MRKCQIHLNVFIHASLGVMIEYGVKHHSNKLVIKVLVELKFCYDSAHPVQTCIISDLSQTSSPSLSLTLQQVEVSLLLVSKGSA